MRLLVLRAAATAPLPDAAVRDTIASVFSHPGYDRSLRRSLGDRIIEWVSRAISSGIDAIRGSADIRWIVIALVVLLVTIVLARAVFLVSVNARQTRNWSRRSPRPVDPWQAATEAAAAGHYTEATHMLYDAVIETISMRHRIRAHPAKTTGEYERDLRNRSPEASKVFAAFAREYERVVWRSRTCDERTYRRLAQLATAVAAPVAADAAA